MVLQPRMTVIAVSRAVGMGVEAKAEDEGPAWETTMPTSNQARSLTILRRQVELEYPSPIFITAMALGMQPDAGAVLPSLAWWHSMRHLSVAGPGSILRRTSACWDAFWEILRPGQRQPLSQLIPSCLSGSASNCGRGAHLSTPAATEWAADLHLPDPGRPSSHL